MDGQMDYIDEFFSSLSPEEMQYAHSKMKSAMGKGMGKGPKVEIEIESDDSQEEPNDSDSDEFTNGKGPNNEAKGGDSNATVPKALADSVKKKKDSIPLKEAEMFDEEEY
jgi:nitroimidazol reductase NimA-like FMN-containing flavoprotein (pyridoxamine 5'-phosphate oxidase superfamily)